MVVAHKRLASQSDNLHRTQGVLKTKVFIAASNGAEGVLEIKVFITASNGAEGVLKIESCIAASHGAQGVLKIELYLDAGHGAEGVLGIGVCTEACTELCTVASDGSAHPCSRGYSVAQVTQDGGQNSSNVTWHTKGYAPVTAQDSIPHTFPTFRDHRACLSNPAEEVKYATFE